MSTESSTIHRASAMPLPELLQALAQQRQSSLIQVKRKGDGDLTIVIDDGHISAMQGFPTGSLVRACVWSGLLTLAAIKKVCGNDIIDTPNYEAARILAKGRLLDQRTLKTAIENLHGEAICELVTEQEHRWQHLEQLSVDEWLGLLKKLKLKIPIGGLLMEGARRLDEMTQIEECLIDDWDLLVVDEKVLQAQSDLDEREQSVVNAYAHGLTLGEVVRVTWIPPWHVRMIAALMIQRGVLKLVAPAQLIVRADRCREDGDGDKAEGLYRRAIRRGADVARVYFAMGELAEKRGSRDRAAGDFLAAGNKFQANAPDQAIVAYERALQLGADPGSCLDKLLAIYKTQGDQTKSIEVLFQLAGRYTAANDLPKAMQAVNRARELGADPLRSVRSLARYAQQMGAEDQAVSHWQEVLRLSTESGDASGQREARSEILGLDPGQLIMARDHARDLITTNETDMAVKALRAAIKAPQPRGTFEDMIACRELLAEHTADTENSSWLSRAYHQRSDQAEGVNRLYSVAERQEKAGDLTGLCSTLRRLVDLDNNQIRAWRWLALTESEQGQFDQAMSCWHRAVDAAMDMGDFEQAATLVEEGRVKSPFDVKLLLGLVRCYNRLGRREQSLEACFTASRLARIAGDLTVARQCLTQLLNVLPDSIVIHAELVDVLTAQAADDLDGALRAAIDIAWRTSNFGLALQWNEQLLERLPMNAWTERERYLDLLMAAAEDVAMLQRGRELVVDMMAEDESRRAIELLDKLIASFPHETVLQIYHARLLAERGKTDAALGSFRRAIATLQQADELNKAMGLIAEMREHFPDEPIIDEVEELIRAGNPVIPG